MGLLKVKCIKCNKEWKKEVPIEPEPGAVTSSLCKLCFRTVVCLAIRKHQKRDGHFDCFATAEKYCDQLECKYREWCILG